MKKIYFVIALLLIVSCNNQETTKTTQLPINFESGEECHLCGMIILKFQGPKGQAFQNGKSSVKKFCSTMDMFAWYLQPENKPNISEMYVHDMAQNDWQSPVDTQLFDARKAHYVVGSSRKGSMGNTFASFKLEVDAADFANQWGGRIVTFDQITIETTME